MDELRAMGFDPDLVQQAWTACDGNKELAIEVLLTGGDPSENHARHELSSELIQCDISQYSIENGRSACTCIALAGATLYLDNQEISSELVRDMVIQGAEFYKQIAKSESGVEHMSAEEVLAQDVFPLRVIGGVRQGILSLDSNHRLGLMALLRTAKDEGARVVLITKTPETVVVCLDQFVLLDSHPRPPMASSAYAKMHENLEDLVQTLQHIFPPTELDPDIPEMMAMMYNSFDLYPLAIRG
jgi:UBA/TS-N domain